MERAASSIGDGETELAVSLETVCFIIMKAREFDAKNPVTEPNPASNPSDDHSAAILEDHADDPVLEELRSLISDLSVDAQIDLVALMWLGRDDNPPTSGKVSASKQLTRTTSILPTISVGRRCLQTI